MAAVYSLGLHEPTALSYLVGEGILPSNPAPTSYKWHYQKGFEEGGDVIDEILQTSTCVVWSRSGTIKRVFNLDVEGEPITHAFATQFEHTGASTSAHSTSPFGAISTDETAFCVILKTQAHIFLLSGDTHILPLSFEVEKAIRSRFGFFLQRPRFFGPNTDSAPPSGQFPSPDNVASLKLPRKWDQWHDESTLLPSYQSGVFNTRLSLPRTFCFPQLLSEISLVVSGAVRKHEPTANCSLLPAEEEIIYVSNQNELHEIGDASTEPIYLAATVNAAAKTLTLWRVVFGLSDENPGTKQKSVKSTKKSGSGVYGRQAGVATPSIRGPGALRESLGGPMQPESGPLPVQREQPKSQADLASQLGHEFEQVGVQTRSSRRVSSMLARTDLGAANDRSAFNETVTGTIGRKSFGRSIGRGESLGGFSDRLSFGARRRSSFQAASSIYSDGTSFLDIPASHLLDEGPSSSGMDAFDETIDVATSTKFSRDVAFLKVKSLPYECTTASLEDKFRVITLLAPDRSTADDRRSRIICVCVMDRNKQEMTIVNVAAKIALSASSSSIEKISYDLKAVEVQRGQSIVDACSVIDEYTKRLLILTQTREGRSVLHLEAPWSMSYRVSLPTHFKVFDSSSLTPGDSPVSRRETGIGRVIPDTEVEVSRLESGESKDEVSLFDTKDRCHRVRFRLAPVQPLVRKVLQLCNFVLVPEFTDCILVAWWEVKRWIEMQEVDDDIEWTAMTVTLFMLAIPFISNISNRPAQGPRRKKGGVLRSSSGPAIDQSDWNLMLEFEKNSVPAVNSNCSSWSWATMELQPRVTPKSPSKHLRNASTGTNDDPHTNAFLIRCINLAREFLQSPAGENATGTEGYLPTAVNKERSLRRTALANILVGLHLLREELKLYEVGDGVCFDSAEHLAVVVVQISSWLQWTDWCAKPGQYYHTEMRDPTRWQIESSVIDSLETPAQPFSPPSIFNHVTQSIAAQERVHFPSILDLVSNARKVTQSHPIRKQALRITPRLFAITQIMEQIAPGEDASAIVKYMLKAGITKHMLSTLPLGIASIFNQAIVTVRAQPPTDSSDELKSLLGRSDLDKSELLYDRSFANYRTSHAHGATRDYRTIINSAIDADAISRWDVVTEFDRQSITRLIFHEDRRFQEASKLVNQTRPPTVEYIPEPGWSEAELLEAQKELAIHVTRRTLSVAAGRSMMHYNARVPLLTERVPIPAFSLQCVMRSRDASDNSQSMTLSADKALFTEDKVCWAFFHNGASAGLMISKDTKWIDTSWILYNKPPELTNRHAGFLLALGLNGHLRSLAKWVAFKYLTPKHTMTSVGLLLGLAASYLGTMDTLIARLLSVHVTRLLPAGAAELNLSPLTQTTGIMGVGLLYCNSQHRRMSEIMLSEIENNDAEDRSGDDPILRDEGYRLAAGFSLGLINLGQGQNLHTLHDTAVVERLLNIAIGTKNVTMVHVLDRATAGAVIAIAFIFLKTNDETIASKIDIPDTTHQFDYVRPDIFLLRTLAKHLIMWDNITPTREFVRRSLPPIFSKRVDLATTKRLSTDDLSFFNIVAGICFAMSLRFAGSHRHDARDLLVSYLDQFLRLARLPALNYDTKVTLNGVRNCLDVLALSCATVMAGSGDILVLRRLRALHGRTDKETPFGSHLAAHMALGILFLSGGTAAFGTGNLAIAALVISLYPVFPVDVLDNKGHLQALRHLWVLAVEDRCLIARDVETQQIIGTIEAEIELTNGTIQKVVTPGLIPPFDTVRRIQFNHESYWPMELKMDANLKRGTMPRMVYGLDEKVLGSLGDLMNSQGPGLRVQLQRRAAYEKPDGNAFFSELQALDSSRGVPSRDPNSIINEKWRQAHGRGSGIEETQTQNPLDWIFSVPSLQQLTFAERALVLDDAESVSAGNTRIFDTTVVDAILDFTYGCLGVGGDGETEEVDQQRRVKALPEAILDKDKLWQLKILLDWTDRWESEQEEVTQSDKMEEPSSARWITKEVIEQLRWKVWKLTEENEG